MPVPSVAVVERRRLLNLLASSSDVPIVLISASAGYGKSTLAAQWAARCQRTVAWLNVDHADNNPLVLLNHIAHALEQCGAVAPELFDELSTPAPRVEDVVLPEVARQLECMSPVALILDDVNQLTEPRSLAVVDFLVEEIPPESQFVLTTRTAAELHLTRRRVAGDLLEILPDRLALDADETKELAAARGALLSERALTLVHQRTEGWPAGIALALRAASDPADGDAVAQGLRGTQREIADYLLEAVLERETEEHRTFLLATSVLRRMTAPLCDAVLGTSGSIDIIRELEQSNSFVIPLDDERGWYRYHQLFRELLCSELARRHPGFPAVYLARAAEWHEEDGTDPEEAFRCAHECGDLARAGRIALGSAAGFVGRGQVETMRLWLRDCTDDELEADPQLAIAAAWVCLLMGESERAERLLLAAERGNLDVPSADGTTSLRSSLANVRSSLGPGGIHQMLADAEFMYAAESAEKTRWVSASCRAIGTANVLLDRPEAAIAAFQEALMLYDSGRSELALPRVLCLGYLAFAAVDKGDWPSARKWARDAKALVVDHRLDDTLAGAIACTARATTLVHDGDSDRAAHELAAARHSANFARGTRWLSADLDLRWGEISLDLGERLVAKEHALRARATLQGYPDPAALAFRLDELETRIDSAAELHLTPAELRVAPFLATHLAVKEIAAHLHIGAATVKTHLSQIYAKLGVSTRSEAVEKMEQLGLEHNGTPRDWQRSEQEQAVDE
jgi:LuxR family maltose regulon positive regulatory protein